MKVSDDKCDAIISYVLNNYDVRTPEQLRAYVRAWFQNLIDPPAETPAPRCEYHPIFRACQHCGIGMDRGENRECSGDPRPEPPAETAGRGTPVPMCTCGDVTELVPPGHREGCPSFPTSEVVK